MKAIPLALASLTGLALAGPLVGRQNRAPTQEEACANYGGDVAACQRDARECISELRANNQPAEWDAITKCMNLRRPAPPKPQAVEPPPPTKEPQAVEPPPTKEVICADFNGDDEACQREVRACATEQQAKGQPFEWNSIMECMKLRRPAAPKPQAVEPPPPTKEPQAVEPPPTKEVICADFNGDDEACQREVRACATEQQAKGQPFDWKSIMECMKLRRTAAAEPPPATGQASFKADIRVDTNRDGVVDLEGSTDVEGKGTWSETSGAIFLANIGDTGGRCSQLGPSKDPRSSLETLAQCHDAADDTQRAPQYMAPIRTVPIAGLSGSATATISVSDPVARPLVRIFRPKGDGWEIVNNDTVFSSEEVAKGLTLGIDARDTRRAGGWDGRASVDFTIKDGGSTSTDTVMLRLAPVLIHSHRQAIQKVFSAGFPGNPPQLTKFIDDIMSGIESSMQKAQVPGPLNRLPTGDAWAQDFFEPGYTSMPGPNGTISLRVMIEGRRNYRDAVRLIYTHLRTDGVGALDATSNKRIGDTFQAGGNIETIPPYEFNGKKYPAGRVIMGGDQNNFPRARDFFRAQELQDPLIVDSTWLFVKHIDEMMQFLPAKTPRGWSIVAVDPQLGITLLKAAQSRGYGKQPVITAENPTSSLLRPTIDEFLATESNIQAAELSAQRMQSNIDIMKRETGISDAEIFRVPSLIGQADLVHDHLRPRAQKRRRLEASEEEALDSAFFDLIDFHGPGGDSEGNETVVERRQSPSEGKPISLDSYLPSLVNGIPLSDSNYLAPKPWGPIIDGRDMFEVVATSVYQKAGFTTVDFVDEWKFHANDGDLHCMTNTFRDASAPWW